MDVIQPVQPLEDTGMSQGVSLIKSEQSAISELLNRAAAFFS